MTSNIQTALNNLAGFSGNTVVASSGPGVYVIIWQGAFAGGGSNNPSAPTLVFDSVAATGPYITNATTTPGVASTTSAVQTLTFAGSPTGGNFTLNYGGQTTGVIVYSGTPATLVANIQQALNDLPDIGGLASPGSVVVATTGATTYTLTFGGSLAKQPISLVGTNSNGLTATVNPAVVTAVTTVAALASIAHQTLAFSGPITGGSFTLSINGQTTAISYPWNSNTTTLASTISTALNSLAYISGNGGGHGGGNHQPQLRPIL